jgi:hypothetical protein
MTHHITDFISAHPFTCLTLAVAVVFWLSGLKLKS